MNDFEEFAALMRRSERQWHLLVISVLAYLAVIIGLVLWLAARVWWW